MIYEDDCEDDSEVAKFHFRIQHMYNPEGVNKLLKEMHKEVNGNQPNDNTDLLEWFFEHYVYEGNDTWVLRNGSIH